MEREREREPDLERERDRERDPDLERERERDRDGDRLMDLERERDRGERERDLLLRSIERLSLRRILLSS
jgi:hypothetical protein